jgi:hypothetical protein
MLVFKYTRNFTVTIFIKLARGADSSIAKEAFDKRQCQDYGFPECDVL